MTMRSTMPMPGSEAVAATAERTDAFAVAARVGIRPIGQSNAAPAAAPPYRLSVAGQRGMRPSLNLGPRVRVCR